jgi:hypothetical protein
VIIQPLVATRRTRLRVALAGPLAAWFGATGPAPSFQELGLMPDPQRQRLRRSPLADQRLQSLALASGDEEVAHAASKLVGEDAHQRILPGSGIAWRPSRLSMLRASFIRGQVRRAVRR